jgi:hypothetical protein
MRRWLWLFVTCIALAGASVWLWQQFGGSALVAVAVAAIVLTVMVAVATVYLAGSSGEQLSPPRNKPTGLYLQRELYILVGYGNGCMLVARGLVGAVVAIGMGISEGEPLLGILTGIAFAVIPFLGGCWLIRFARRIRDDGR